MTGQLYTDQEAPAHLRSAAQGVITFLTYGVGMLIGSLVSGRTIDYFTHEVGGVLTRNWQSFWISSALTAFLILLLVAMFFRTDSRIENEKPSTLPIPETANVSWSELARPTSSSLAIRGIELVGEKFQLRTSAWSNNPRPHGLEQ
jgi:MFS family permease